MIDTDSDKKRNQYDKGKARITREYGRVISTESKNGSVRCDVQVDRFGRTIDDVLVQKTFPGCTIVPERGWWVSVDVHEDGMKMVNQVLSGPEVTDSENFLETFLRGGQVKRFQIADDLPPGTMLWQMDRSTAIYAKKRGDYNYDLELHAGGDIKLKAGGKITTESNVYMTSDKDGITQGDRETKEEQERREDI